MKMSSNYFELFSFFEKLVRFRKSLFSESNNKEKAIKACESFEKLKTAF
jgi:hypothetical protein